MKRFLVLLALLAAPACNWGRETPLRFNLVSETLELDWNRVSEASSVAVLDNVMEGLTSYAGSLHGSDSNLLRPGPALAASWSVSEGGLVYHFHLRPNAVWSDGEPLRAQHFVDSWERLLNPEIKAESAYQLFAIVGAQEYNRGHLRSFGRVGVRAIDDLTLEVRLRYPVPYFLHQVASPSTFPLRRDLVLKFGSQWTKPENLVTLGAYRIADWRPGEHIRLEANERYYGSPPAIRRVELKLAAEPATALALYESGSIDVLPRDLPARYSEYWKALPDYRSGPKLFVSYLAFNVRRPPFHSREARKAFARRVNRESLARFHGGSFLPLRSWIPPGLFAFRETLGLADAEAKTKLPFAFATLRFAATDPWNLSFQELQRAIQAGGAELRLEPRESREYQTLLTKLGSGKKPRPEELPSLLHLGWVADYPDPHTFMNVFTSASESNFTGWHNARYDQLVREAVAAESEAKRTQLYEEAQRILVEEEAVIIPLFHGTHQALVKPYVRGVVLNSLDRWYFKTLRIER